MIITIYFHIIIKFLFCLVSLTLQIIMNLVIFTKCPMSHSEMAVLWNRFMGFHKLSCCYMICLDFRKSTKDLAEPLKTDFHLCLFSYLNYCIIGITTVVLMDKFIGCWNLFSGNLIWCKNLINYIYLCLGKIIKVCQCSWYLVQY